MILDEKGNRTQPEVGDVFRLHRGNPPNIEILRRDHVMKQKDALFVTDDPDNVSILFSLISEIFGIIFDRSCVSDERIDYTVVNLQEDP